MAKVLVVDDDAMNLKMAEFILKKGNYEFEKASGGAQAIEFLQENSVDLILLDILMPDMDGFETLANIKAQGILGEAKVAFLTAAIDDEVISKASELGVKECIGKPFVPATFLDKIQEILT